MRWLNPVAFLGMLALSVPVFVHLFGRRIARRQRFPSLRLLQLATPSASTRSAPSDILLLVLRCAVVAAAALALAQPAWPSRDAAAGGAPPVRAIIVDTTISMRRLTSDGSTARDRARELAAAQLDSARAGIVIETAMPGANIRAAGSWLEKQPGLRQVVVISDYQRGAVQDGDLAHLPGGVGFRPMRIEVPPADSVWSDSAAVMRVTLLAHETAVDWSRGTTDSAELPVTILSSPADSLKVRSSRTVARRLVPYAIDAAGIVLVYPGYPGANELVRQWRRLDKPSQGDFLLRLRAQPLVRHVEPAAGSSACNDLRAGAVYNAHGEVVAIVAPGAGSRTDLFVFSCALAGSVSGTALLAAVVLAAAPVPPALSEAEPFVLPDELLRTWERTPLGTGSVNSDDSSPNGRWLWLVALLMLVVEEWIRRRTPRATAHIPAAGQQRVA